MADTDINDVSVDSAITEPEKDRLGYAPFAQHLADSICKMTVAEGFAIAVYGSWSSGKSTLLNLVVHYLQEKPDEEQPIIVPFNPWLFSGYEDITRRFFDQLENVLSRLTTVSKGLRERIADIGKTISEIPLPYANAGKAVATLFDDKEKDASELKEEVEDKLTKQDRRIVVTVDDLDRLPAEDIKKLFRLFKATPNFTNVVYLLVFTKEIVIEKLTDNQESSGESYLEKVIQFGFDLPLPDKTSLRRLLFEKLDSILVDTPNELFDEIYWSNVYFCGIDYFITNLRDIIRLSNALSVTYPVVKGEVNPVDFIAFESLRVFCPMVYEIIRQNSPAFVGEASDGVDVRHFHNSWLAQLKDEEKEPVKKLLMCLFPKLKVVWGNSDNDGKKQLQLCEQLRICCPETFPVYFRLTLSTGELSDTEIKSILDLAIDAKLFGEKLIELANRQRPDGTTQLRAFLEQLENYTEKEIPKQRIPAIVTAFFDVSEELLRLEDEPITMFDLGNKNRISRIISQLLRRLEKPARFEVLKRTISQGEVSIINYVIAQLKEECLISESEFEELEGIVNEDRSPD